MKISTRGRYALRMMLDMALSDSDKPVRVKEIAERQEISEKYMEQIMSVEQSWFCEKCQRTSGRLFPDEKAGRIYGRHDSSVDRRKFKPGRLSGRRRTGVQSYGQLYHHFALEKAG